MPELCPYTLHITGEADYEMLKILLSRHQQIRNVVIEPVDQMMQKYRHLVTSHQQSLSGVVFDWRQQKYEDYQQDCKLADDGTKFHFIHAIHSLYHFPDLDAVLKSFFDRLKIGGILLIMINSEKSGISRVYKKFHDDIEVDSTMQHVTSADVQRALKKRGLTYQVYPQSFGLDITKCFQDGDEDGDLILDFLTNKINFRYNAPTHLVEEYLQFLKEPQCSQLFGDKVLLNMDWNVIVV